MRATVLVSVGAAAVIAVVTGWLFWVAPSRSPLPSARSLPPVEATVAPPVAAPATPPVPQAEFGIELANEQQIRDHVPNGMTVFRFAQNPNVIILDFASLRQQGMMLNRIAALTEKSGIPHAQVLSDVELGAAIRAEGETIETYYYGHDYSAAELARFFAMADAQHLVLSPEEETLRQLARQLGWFTPGIQAGLISIPKVGADSRTTYEARTTILHHELSHGEYFSNRAYADYVHQFWLHALSQAERDGVKRFLASEGYDTSLEELVENEMQAYLMFTRDPGFFTPARIGVTPKQLTDLQTEFLHGMPAGWLRDALASSQAVPVATP